MRQFSLPFFSLLGTDEMHVSGKVDPGVSFESGLEEL